jgi:hypothetical protein
VRHSPGTATTGQAGNGARPSATVATEHRDATGSIRHYRIQTKGAVRRRSDRQGRGVPLEVLRRSC